MALFALWIIKNERPDYKVAQLPTEASVDEYLRIQGHEPVTRIKTGIFIQSLQFQGSSDVHLTGYIWQHYEDGIHDDIKPLGDEVGFILPEAVNEAGGEIREAYRHPRENGEVIGWYFEQVVRQTFDYTDYPFDHKVVWLRLWPKDLNQNIVLVPDFFAYDHQTGVCEVFGIEKQIVLGGWERKSTYFHYEPADFDTNFGIPDEVGQTGFPELHYNVHISRKFENAFIVYMIPLFVVATLLFGALMTNTREQRLTERHGANTTNVIGTCSVLFFVVLLAHVQLRDSFPGSHVVYLEYFYFMMYFLFLSVSINTYILALEPRPGLWFVHYKDNLIPKAAFWPVLIASMVVITLLSWSEPPQAGVSDTRPEQQSCPEEVND
jgi:hypothetical protein